MKKVLLLALLVAGSLMSSAQVQPQQQDPDIPIIMRMSDWNQIIAIIHKSAVDGSIRDQYINMIKTQGLYQLQMQAKRDSTASKPVDSTKVTKPVPKGTKKDTSKKPAEKVTNIENAETVNIKN